MFVSYDSWRYQKRCVPSYPVIHLFDYVCDSSERWQIGLNAVKLFHAILSSPALPNPELLSATTTTTREGRPSLRQYLFDLIVNEQAVHQVCACVCLAFVTTDLVRAIGQQALLRPIVIGAGIAEKLQQERKTTVSRSSILLFIRALIGM